MLSRRVGRSEAIRLMEYVDEINMSHGGAGTKLYSTAGSDFKKKCIQNRLNLLDASVRHLGTDKNYVVLSHLYEEMKDHITFLFRTPVQKIRALDQGYEGGSATCLNCIVSVGRSGSKWMQKVCEDLHIRTKSDRVDLGVRVELPAVVFEDITEELYEGKIVYRTQKFEDQVRTFCMNPRGAVVTENTNFALLVSKHFRSRLKTVMNMEKASHGSRICWETV